MPPEQPIPFNHVEAMITWQLTLTIGKLMFDTVIWGSVLILLVKTIVLTRKTNDLLQLSLNMHGVTEKVAKPITTAATSIVRSAEVIKKSVDGLTQQMSDSATDGEMPRPTGLPKT